ncbi:MAG: class I SAM-dependent methyltransferase [Thermoplasmata archaeon]
MSPATTRGPSRPPVERVRSELARDAGPDLAAQLPKRYVRLGHVLVVRWPETLRPHFPRLARSLARAHGARTVLRFAGPVQGELRTPRAELLFGSETETEVLEHGVRWRFDAARVLFATGNKIERARAGQVVQPGETVIDLFAGIGYFAIPAARFGHAARVLAVDRNPVSIRYLTVNARLNRVDAVVSPLLGDNRTIDLPTGTADRVFLGYLPSAVPWVGRALPLLRSSGGTLHVHTVANARTALPEAEADVASAVRKAGGLLEAPPVAHVVKPYGPGRTHVVVEVRVRPT